MHGPSARAGQVARDRCCPHLGWGWVLWGQCGGKVTQDEGAPSTAEMGAWLQSRHASWENIPSTAQMLGHEVLAHRW